MRVALSVLADPRIRCPVELAAFCLLTVVLFRPLNRTVLRSRMPFFLLVLCVLFVFSVSDTVSAFGAALERTLGRPLYADPSGLWRAVVALAIVGIPWAVANLASRRAVVLNALALVAAAAYMSLFVFGIMGGSALCP